MVDYLGATIKSPDRFFGDGILSYDVGAWSLTPHSVDLVRSSDESVASSSWQMNQPRPMVDEAIQGEYCPAIDQKFFGHVIVWPRTLDLGLVLSAKLFNIGVWNITGRAQKLLSWSLQGLDGITISNPDNYPVAYEVGRYRAYQVDVGVVGSAQLTGSISFNFEGSISGSTTTVSGSRLVVFGFRPNWREPVREKLEWLTDVLTSRSEKEQRIQLRMDPRRAMRYLFTFKNAEELSFFQGAVWGWQARMFAVPVWTDWAPLGASVAAGSTTIPVATSHKDYNAGGMALLWRQYNTWEVVEIQSVSANSITATKPLSYSWEPMDRIIPIRTGRLDKNLAVSRPNDSVGEANITFTFEVGDAVGPNRLGVSSHTQYNGLDVFLKRPNVINDPTDTYDRAVNLVDFGKGGWSVDERASAPRTTRTYKHTLVGRPEIANFLAFLESHKGMLVPVYMPTWTDDMVQMADIGASESTITIRNINYTRQIKTHPNRATLVFFPVDGSSPIIKQVLNCVESVNNTEILTLNSSFGSIKTVGAFKLISFLVKCRFAADEVELTWHNDSLVEVDFSCVEVML